MNNDKQQSWEKDLEKKIYKMSMFQLKKFISTLLQHEREELAGKIEGMKKQKTADRQLIHFDHTTEQIKYYENDSDPAFNDALSQVLNLIKPNTPPNAGD